MSGRNARLFRRFCAVQRYQYGRTIDPKDLARQWRALNHRQRGARRPALRRMAKLAPGGIMAVIDERRFTSRGGAL